MTREERKLVEAKLYTGKEVMPAVDIASEAKKRFFASLSSELTLASSLCLVSEVPAREEPFQGVRGQEHLPATAHRESMQGVQGRELLSAPAPEGQMQGVRTHQEPTQGVQRSA